MGVASPAPGPQIATATTDFSFASVATTPCRESDEDLWFAEQSHDIERAKALCAPCPLRAACLRGALERAEPWGVWGGESLADGVVIKNKRGRGRPPKNQLSLAG
ncbi:hypothetical protein GCM10010407_01530 [Rarobacter incanus]